MSVICWIIELIFDNNTQHIQTWRTPWLFTQQLRYYNTLRETVRLNSTKNKKKMRRTIKFKNPKSNWSQYTDHLDVHAYFSIYELLAKESSNNHLISLSATTHK